jgi:hypothetical protein
MPFRIKAVNSIKLGRQERCYKFDSFVYKVRISPVTSLEHRMRCILLGDFLLHTSAYLLTMRIASVSIDQNDNLRAAVS